MAARIKEERELEREQAREEKEEPERQTKEERELQREQVREERRDRQSQHKTRIQSTDASVGIESSSNSKTSDNTPTLGRIRPGRPGPARPASDITTDDVPSEHSERRARLVVDPFCGTWKCEYASKL
jgi:hypothetical protein